MKPGIDIDPAQNYEDAARVWATRLDVPFHPHGRPLALDLDLLQALFQCYPETIEYIEVDPPAFAQRVAEYRSGNREVQHG
jgi:hypothetical protein